MPPVIRSRMADILGHVGAWAPKPEQVATAAFLGQAGEIRSFQARMKEALKERLDLLYEGFSAMKAAGLPVEVVEPQGAIYLSVRIGLVGRRFNGTPLRTNEDVRELILRRAGFGVVPFQAFGLKEESGWFRISVGSVSVDDVRAAIPRVRAVVEEAARG
jgi:aspartate aminotransferase